MPFTLWIVSHSNIVTSFFEISVGNTNAFKYGRPRARSSQLNGIANMNISKQKVPIMLCALLGDERGNTSGKPHFTNIQCFLFGNLWGKTRYSLFSGRWNSTLPGFYSREPQRERGALSFPRCVLIGGMHETSNADWWDAGLTSQLTPLFLWASLLDSRWKLSATLLDLTSAFSLLQLPEHHPDHVSSHFEVLDSGCRH